MMNKKVAFYTLGCRLNFSETAEMADIFAKNEYKMTSFGNKASITIVNTCTVTSKADATCRNLIRKAKRLSPNGRIVVTGCYAQMESKKISKMPEVDLVLGTSEKYRILNYLNQMKNSPSKEAPVYTKRSRVFRKAMGGLVESGRTRSFFKIQDGCNYRCSFCIIPQARGVSRSIAIKDAFLGIKSLAQQGLNEIVLTGVNIGEYERERGESLPSLIRAISTLNRPSRLRLSSVEPNTITEELLAALSSTTKFMPHFHIPLQSGNDIILKKMRRRYTIKEYEEIAHQVKKLFPRAALGADIICGFPGESEKQFQDTYHFVKKMPLTHLHVFPFSRRKETMAAQMENQIEEGVKKSRVKRLLALGEEKLYQFTKQQLSQTSEVLFENCDNKGKWWGYTPNYVKTFVFSRDNLHNKILKVKHEEIDRGHLKSTLVPGQ